MINMVPFHSGQSKGATNVHVSLQGSLCYTKWNRTSIYLINYTCVYLQVSMASRNGDYPPSLHPPLSLSLSLIKCCWYSNVCWKAKRAEGRSRSGWERRLAARARPELDLWHAAVEWLTDVWRARALPPLSSRSCQLELSLLLRRKGPPFSDTRWVLCLFLADTLCVLLFLS